MKYKKQGVNKNRYVLLHHQLVLNIPAASKRHPIPVNAGASTSILSVQRLMHARIQVGKPCIRVDSSSNGSSMAVQMEGHNWKGITQILS